MEAAVRVVWEQLVCSWKTAFASSNRWNEIRSIQQLKVVKVQAGDGQVGGELCGIFYRNGWLVALLRK